MPESTPSSPNATAVETHGLRVVRGSTTILDGLDCRIMPGQCVALLGPNGCGKTTFARTLTGHVFASEGSVRVLGQTLGQTNLRALRKRIGVVNPTTDPAPGSEPVSLHVTGAVVDAELSVTDAVCTGYFATVGLYDRPTDAQRDHARALLCRVGLGHRLETPFALLSTGEQRRGLIARALVHLPQLLILDEVTAGLDIAGREQVLATIEQLLAAPDAPAVVFITHHVEELSPRTSLVYLMREGRFVAHGPPEAIITPERLTETFGCRVYVRRVHGRYWLEVLPEAWLDLLPRTHPNQAEP
ncbi:MAG: ATP-binding cassette domain-containing protein [Planctomycetes bacterium]|nr:ATP-binding cassette domain-containing protein [Planctomycetota bacterium]